MRPQRLSTKFSLAIALLVTVSLGLMSVLAVTASRNSLREGVLSANLTAATLAARAVEQYVADAMSIMEEASGRPKLSLEIRRANWPEVTTVLSNFLRHFGQFDYVFVQDPAGVIRARVPYAETVGRDFSFRDFFGEVMRTRGLYVSGVYASTAAGRPVVAIAVPVLDGGGAVSGVLVGALSLDTMSRFVSAIGQGEGGHIYVVDAKGVVVAHWFRAAVGSHVGTSAQPIVRRVLAGQSGTMEFRESETGEDTLAAYVPIRRLGWGVVAAKPVSVAYAAATRLAWWLSWIAVGCAAAAVLLGWGLARTLTGSLQRLGEATGQIAHGNFAVRVASRSQDELAALATAFNHMAGEVEKSYAGLAQKTAEAETANAALLREITERKRVEEARQQSEASFRLLFASNPLPMWVYDVATMSFLEVNAAAVAHYGYSRDEFLQMRISDIRPPEDVPRLKEVVAGLAAGTGEAVRRHAGTWRHRLKDGRVRNVDVVSHSIEFAGRGAALVVAIDVTELKQAQEALVKSAERLKILHEIDRALIAEEAPVAIAEAALRRLRDLLGVPRAIVNMFDLAAGEAEWLAAAGRRRIRLGPGVRFPLALMGDVEALRRGELQVIDVASLPRSPEAEALLAGGVYTYMVVPMIAGGELIGGLSFGGALGQVPPEQVSIAREVATQLAIAIAQARLYERVKRQAAELEQQVRERTRELSAANEQLVQEIAERRRAEVEADRANRAKSEFLSRMSHELRTPLNAVLGFAQLLEMESVGAEQRDSVNHILKAGRHLLGLINEVLDISRIEAGRLRLSLEPVPVAETLQAAVDLVRPLAAERGIELRAEGPDDRQHVLADRQRLQQVLLNLLSNAVKYNRDGGAVRVTCGGTPEHRLRITVADSGRGMTPEQMAHLFTPFERLGAEASVVEGTGLGLTLSKHLVEAMGGAMQVESQVGVGSAFSLELPVAEAPAEALEPPRTADGRATEARAAGLSVLYIEDNLSNLRLIERVLARRPGTKLLSAMQGRLGLDLAREHRPDLILLDLHLPDLPGEEVLHRLRSDPRTREIPVVVLSADASAGQIERLLGVGARAYLTKPLDVRKLLAVLDERVPGEGG